jgi:hypothetical protein
MPTSGGPSLFPRIGIMRALNRHIDMKEDMHESYPRRSDDRVT